MVNFTNFEDFGTAIVQIAARKHVDFAQTLYYSLVSATPVYTGYARSNWRVSVAKPSTYNPERDPDAFVKDNNKFNPFNVTGEKAVYKTPPFPISKFKKYSDRWRNIYFTNATPYIAELNEGSSKQAPAGFIESTVQATIVKFNNSLVPTNGGAGGFF